MGHYKSECRDLGFQPVRGFGVDGFWAKAFADIDADTARERCWSRWPAFAEGRRRSFADDDHQSPVSDPETANGLHPESFLLVGQAVIDGGWDKVGLEEELGGMPVPAH